MLQYFNHSVWIETIVYKDVFDGIKVYLIWLIIQPLIDILHAPRASQLTCVGYEDLFQEQYLNVVKLLVFI